MGMFDEFIPKEPVVCPGCGVNKFGQFQTKDLECALIRYAEGKPAGTEVLRPFTEKENAMRIEKNLSKGMTPLLAELCGSLSGVPTGEYRSILKDGKYQAYTWCDICKKFIYIDAVVENGIYTRTELHETE